jgi:hypothetical protein
MDIKFSQIILVLLTLFLIKISVADSLFGKKPTQSTKEFLEDGSFD